MFIGYPKRVCTQSWGLRYRLFPSIFRKKTFRLFQEGPEEVKKLSEFMNNLLFSSEINLKKVFGDPQYEHLAEEYISNFMKEVIGIIKQGDLKEFLNTHQEPLPKLKNSLLVKILTTEESLPYFLRFLEKNDKVLCSTALKN